MRNAKVVLPVSALLAVTLLLSGCVGMRSNQSLFLNEPERGMSELTLLQTYGKPDYSAAVEDQKVYIYRVRDEKYIIAVGMSGTYDLVVTCRDGEVVDTKRVAAGDNLAILQPNPWQVIP